MCGFQRALAIVSRGVGSPCERLAPRRRQPAREGDWGKALCAPQESGHRVGRHPPHPSHILPLPAQQPKRGGGAAMLLQPHSRAGKARVAAMYSPLAAPRSGRLAWSYLRPRGLPGVGCEKWGAGCPRGRGVANGLCGRGAQRGTDGSSRNMCPAFAAAAFKDRHKSGGGRGRGRAASGRGSRTS